MRPTTILTVVVLLLVGCGKRPADGGGSDGGGSGGGAGRTATGPGVTDWTRVGDVKVRVTRAEMRRPVTVVVGTEGGGEQTAKDQELNLWVEVANVSADKRMEFSPWIGSEDVRDTPGEVVITDDKGNRYHLVRDDLLRDVKENDHTRSEVMNPGDPPIVWVYRLDRPVSAATELRLSARPPVENPPAGRHDLRIPAAAWKR